MSPRPLPIPARLGSLLAVVAGILFVWLILRLIDRGLAFGDWLSAMTR